MAVDAQSVSAILGYITRLDQFTGTITSAQMIDPYVPVDGTMNVTGALTTTAAIQGTGITGTSVTSTGVGGVSSNIFQGYTAGTTVALLGYPTDGAGAVSIRIAANADLLTPGAKIASFGDNYGSYAEQAFLDLNGSFRSVNGGLAAKVATVQTTTYTATSADWFIPCDVATTGDVTITLPAATAAKGQVLMIKATSLHVSRDININRAGADTITTSIAAGATTLQLSPTATYNCAVLVSDGTSIWYVVNLM